MDYALVNKFQCIRVLEGNSYNVDKSYDWTVTIPYHFAPSEKEEIFNLKMHFQAHQWNQVFEIQDYDEKK
jgi:hypothetical protein